jgi:hypothetical protein
MIAYKVNTDNFSPRVKYGELLMIDENRVSNKVDEVINNKQRWINKFN